MNNDDNTITDDVQRVCHAFLAQPLQQRQRTQQQQRRPLQRRDQQQRLTFGFLPFTRLKAEFVVDFVEQHQHAIDAVEFLFCDFEDDETVNILKNGLATEALSDVRVVVNFHPSLFPNGIRSLSYFRLLVELATILWFNVSRMGDDDFGYIVDAVLTTNGKQRLEVLSVWQSNISSKGLQHATRLVQQSKLEILQIDENNNGIFNDRAQMQLFCDEGLKKTEYLHRFCFRWLKESTAMAITDMLVDALTENTSLTHVPMEQNSRGRHEEPRPDRAIRQRIKSRLESAGLVRNRQMSNVQSLLDRARENPFATPGHFLLAMVLQIPQIHSLFLDFPDLSALYLALRNVTVGRPDGEARPLVLPIVGAMIVQERRSSSTQIQRWWRRCQQEQEEQDDNENSTVVVPAAAVVEQEQRRQRQQAQLQQQEQQLQQQQDDSENSTVVVPAAALVEQEQHRQRQQEQQERHQGYQP